MLSSSTEFRQIFKFAPEWEALLKNWDGNGHLGLSDFLGRIGAKAIFKKALSFTDEREAFVRMLRDNYYLPVLQKMLGSNQNLRRFLGQRYVSFEDQKGQSISMSVELAAKLETVLTKQLAASSEDGFKVLLAPYLQRSVHNAVIDYIKLESSWEKSTLQDIYLDPEQDDPRTAIADDLSQTPENLLATGEQIKQLNELRQQLEAMLREKSIQKEPLMVLDCIFGLGLSKHSTVGQEMTMRECCEKLDIQAETMPRRIARCQVFLDKGLEMVRQRIYAQMPTIADCWQKGLNINTSSRRELGQQLGLTEGEIERLIKGRQYASIDELVDSQVIKPARLPEIIHKGAVAAFVPVELNTATTREIIDILGLAKELAQKIVTERPFKDLSEIAQKGLLAKSELSHLIQRGAVVKIKTADEKRLDINRASAEEIINSGIAEDCCTVLLKLRPFLTWAELEESLGIDNEFWALLRQKFYLGIVSS